MAKDAASKTQITSVGKRRRLKTAVQELMQQSHTGDHSRGRLDRRSRRHRGSDLSVAMSHQDPCLLYTSPSWMIMMSRLQH